MWKLMWNPKSGNTENMINQLELWAKWFLLTALVHHLEYLASSLNQITFSLGWGSKEGQERWFFFVCVCNPLIFCCCSKLSQVIKVRKNQDHLGNTIVRTAEVTFVSLCLIWHYASFGLQKTINLKTLFNRLLDCLGNTRSIQSTHALSEGEGLSGISGLCLKRGEL